MRRACLENNPLAIFAIGLICALLLFGDASADAEKINSQQLRQLIEQGVPVIDVRLPEEWRATGVIPDSYLMTFFDHRGNYDLNGWLSQLFQIAKPSEPVVIICEVGNRSQVISHFLSEGVGFSEVYDATGGMSEWVSKSMPIRPWP